MTIFKKIFANSLEARKGRWVMGKRSGAEYVKVGEYAVALDKLVYVNINRRDQFRKDAI